MFRDLIATRSPASPANLILDPIQDGPSNISLEGTGAAAPNFAESLDRSSQGLLDQIARVEQRSRVGGKSTTGPSHQARLVPLHEHIQRGSVPGLRTLNQFPGDPKLSIVRRRHAVIFSLGGGWTRKQCAALRRRASRLRAIAARLSQHIAVQHGRQTRLTLPSAKNAPPAGSLLKGGTWRWDSRLGPAFPTRWRTRARLMQGRLPGPTSVARDRHGYVAVTITRWRIFRNSSGFVMWSSIVFSAVGWST